MFRAFIIGSLGTFAVLALVAFHTTDFFEQPQAVDWEQHRVELKAVANDLKPGDEAAAKRFDAFVAQTDARIKQSQANTHRTSHKLTVAHLYIAAFVGCTAMFLSFLGLLAWNRTVFGIRLSDSMSFTVLLNAPVMAAAVDGKLPVVRTQLGLLLWYLTEALKLTDQLGRLRLPGDSSVVVETSRVFRTMIGKLETCGVAPVDPHDAEMTALGRAVRDAADVKDEHGRLLPIVERLRGEKEQLERTLADLRRDEAELRRIRNEAGAAEARVQQSFAALELRERRAEASERRVREQIAALTALRGEVQLLMRQLEGWDDSTDGRATQVVAAGPGQFPRLAAVARSFLRRTGDGAVA